MDDIFDYVSTLSTESLFSLLDTFGASSLLFALPKKKKITQMKKKAKKKRRVEKAKRNKK